MKKKKLAALFISAGIIFTSSMSLASTFEFRNISDDSVVYEFEEVLGNPFLMMDIMRNSSNYTILADDGERYLTSEVDAKLKEGSGNLIEAIRDLEPYRPEESSELEVIGIY